MESLTIHRILSELKTIDDRINKSIREFKPLTVKRGLNNLVNNGTRIPISEEDFVSNAESDYQSINALIDRKFKLRSALIRANGQTEVTVAGKKYTISEAIEMRQLIQFKSILLSKMRDELLKAQSTFDQTSQSVDAEFERTVATQTSSLTNKSDISRVRDEYRMTFYKINEVKMVDPLKISEEISKLEKEVNDFTVEIDATLSTVNATTLVEIED